ncbi:UNVERIFIED_CONTAM: hypothetical protein HDU68_009588 [Siphonaria sp. JEL0065]|nr:hypothetical protein HDU68_009588 [Siphonaria sp. JEL0065]
MPSMCVAACGTQIALIAPTLPDQFVSWCACTGVMPSQAGKVPCSSACLGAPNPSTAPMCGGWFSGLISWSAYIKLGASVPGPPSPSPEVKPPLPPSSANPDRGLTTTTTTSVINNPEPTSLALDPGQTNSFPSNNQHTSVAPQPPLPPPPTTQPTPNDPSTTNTSPVSFSAYVIGTLSGATIVLFIGFAAIYARKRKHQKQQGENNTPAEKNDARVVEMDATILAAQLGKQRIIARHDSCETLDSFEVVQNRRKASSIPRLMMIGASASNGRLVATAARSVGGTVKAGATIRTGRSSMSGVGGGGNDGVGGGGGGGAVLGRMSDGLLAGLVAQPQAVAVVLPHVSAGALVNSETEDSLDDDPFHSYVPPSRDSIISELSAQSSSVYMDILERNNDDLDSLGSF